MFSSPRSRLELLFLVVVICLALAVLGGLIWANALYLRHAPPAREFLGPWLGMRLFLREGVSPYSEAAAQQIQVWYYGRLARQGEDPLRVTTPFFFLLLYFPFALLSDYALAFNLWLTLNEAALVVLAFFYLRLPGWRLRRGFVPLFCLIVIFWPHTLLALLNGGTAIPAILAGMGALLVLKEGGKDELAGVLAVLALWQAAMTAPLVIFLCLWALAHRRWGVIWGGMMTFTILVLLAFFLIPDWFWPWLRNLLAEYRYEAGWRPLDFLTGWFPGPARRMAWLLTVVLSLLLAMEWWLARRQDVRYLLWTASLTLAVTPLLGMRTSLAGQMALLFPLVLTAFLAGRRWARARRRWLPYLLLTLPFLLLWGWGARLGMLGDWQAWQTLLFWFLPLWGLLGLYWLRWYAFRLPPTWLEEEL
jgi:hypothetical protein